MTYESFAKEMLENGYSWDEVEYYWRHPEEMEELEINETEEIRKAEKELEELRNRNIQKDTECNNGKIDKNNKIILASIFGIVFGFTILLFAGII